jgi:ankyrin repeat protein
MLLAKGANPNVKNKVGGTPLMWAAVYGNEAAARMLLEHGADASLKDEDGVTAAGWASKNKREELAKLLRDAEKTGTVSRH